LEERLKKLEAKAAEMEKAILVIGKDGKDNKNKNDALNDGLKALGNSITELFEAIKATKSDSKVASGVEINEETLELHIKKILLDDPDLRETFKRVIENITTYNHNKDKINEYVEEKNSKKQASFLQKNKLSLFIAFFAIVATGFFWFSFSPATIRVTASDMIYSDGDSKGFQISGEFEYKILKVKDGKTYFSADGKTYYVKKKPNK